MSDTNITAHFKSLKLLRDVCKGNHTALEEASKAYAKERADKDRVMDMMAEALEFCHKRIRNLSSVGSQKDWDFDYTYTYPKTTKALEEYKNLKEGG